MTVVESELTELDHVKNAVRLASFTHQTFTSDDVWRLLPFEPSTNRLVGGAFSALSTAGEIKPAGYEVPSQRPSTKGRYIPMWRKSKGYKAK